MSISEQAVRTALMAMEAELKRGDSPKRSDDYLAVARWQAVLQANGADDAEIGRLTIRALTLLTWVPTVGEFLALRQPTENEREYLWQAAIEAAMGWTPYAFGKTRREGAEAVVEAFENPPPTLPTPEATEALRIVGVDTVRDAARSGDPWVLRDAREQFCRALLAAGARTREMLEVANPPILELAGKIVKTLDKRV